MNLVMLGALAGGVSGAAGYFLAGKFHEEEKIETLYPVYAIVFFCTIIISAKFLVL
jgi:hypothetical protein